MLDWPWLNWHFRVCSGQIFKKNSISDATSGCSSAPRTKQHQAATSSFGSRYSYLCVTVTPSVTVTLLHCEFWAQSKSFLSKFLAKLFGCFMLRYPVYFGPNILFCWCVNNICLKTWNPDLAFWPDMDQCNTKDVILEQTVLQFVLSHVVYLLYIINENHLSPHNSDTDEWWLSIDSFSFGCYSHQ